MAQAYRKTKVLKARREGKYLVCRLAAPWRAEEVRPGRFMMVRIPGDGEMMFGRPFGISRKGEGWVEFTAADQRHYHDYVGRLGTLLTGGRHVCPVAMLFGGNSKHVGKATTPAAMTGEFNLETLQLGYANASTLQEKTGIPAIYFGILQFLVLFAIYKAIRRKEQRIENGIN